MWRFSLIFFPICYLETYFAKLLVELNLIKQQTPDYSNYKAENGFNGFNQNGACRKSVVARNEARLCCGKYSENNRRLSVLSKC